MVVAAVAGGMVGVTVVARSVAQRIRNPFKRKPDTNDADAALDTDAVGSNDV
jgi:hypothetical protein